MSNPILNTQLAMSGEGLRRRMDAGEARAVNPNAQRKKKKKPQPEPNTVVPKQKFVDARAQEIDRARAADEAAIAARGLRRNS